MHSLRFHAFVQGLFVKSLAFLRLPGFVIFWLLSKFAGSPRARQRLWMYQYTDSGTTVVDHGMTVLLGLVGGAARHAEGERRVQNPLCGRGSVVESSTGRSRHRACVVCVCGGGRDKAGVCWRHVYGTHDGMHPQVFCCINPIVCPAALAYFLVTGLSERYNTIYVFRWVPTAA